MKVGVIGSGGREHAICISLKKSKNIDKIYCFPGNAGTSFIAENIEIELNNFEELKRVIEELGIDIIIVGPEKPLVDGIVDFLELNKIKVFGPDRISSQLEGSKIFTKNLCKKYNIPTAKFGVFNSIQDSLSFLNECKFPIVVKADGLAAGKGVYICETNDQSKKAVEEIFNGKFGEAKQILIEEFLKGEEMSFFIISDGENYKKFGSAQDHKRVLEGDEGKNTGGMGAYAPAPVYTDEVKAKTIERIVEPMHKDLSSRRVPYRGVLYVGLMIDEMGAPSVVEYNVRFGDPETQVTVPLISSDLCDLLLAVAEGRLAHSMPTFHDAHAMTVVLAAEGYPGPPVKGRLIGGDISPEWQPMAEGKYLIHHAGTGLENGKLISTGGRVLAATGISENSLESAKNLAYKCLSKVQLEGSHFRRDIGHRAL